MTKITLLRHGQTDFNAQGRLQGRIDNPLNDIGVQQAKRAAKAIGPVDKIISSPLQRAIQTAEVFNKEIETDEKWIELDYGEWDGAHLDTISKETWSEWKNNPSFTPPKGESLETLGARVKSFLENVQRNSKQHLLIVTHVSPIKAAVAWTLGVDDSVGWRTRLDTASFTQIQIDASTPVLLKFNHTAEKRN